MANFVNQNIMKLQDNIYAIFKLTSLTYINQKKREERKNTLQFKYDKRNQAKLATYTRNHVLEQLMLRVILLTRENPTLPKRSKVRKKLSKLNRVNHE